MARGRWFRVAVLCIWIAGMGTAASGGNPSFVNWETPHVHPLDTTPGGASLLAVNTADNRLEVFTIGTGLVHEQSIPVGLDPVSVRARTATECWVVNSISDSVSVIDLETGNVMATLRTRDEPADVVFAGDPQRAFVTCAQESVVMVFDPADLASEPEVISLFGEEPRALAVSADGSEVYVAFFESGNGSTSLGGIPGIGVGGTLDAFPPDVVAESDGPHDGENPPPNDGDAFSPGEKVGNPAPPSVSLIVKKSTAGAWLDDNGGDWTTFVTGADAALSGRPVGWDVPDHDVAVIDAGTLAVRYIDRLMNICMAVAVHPKDARVTVVGTDGTNETRFEPNIQGRFIRVEMALADAKDGRSTLVDLNPHLAYDEPTIDQSERDKSVGDPRAIVWNAAGTLAYVSGKGSNNVVVMADGKRDGAASGTIEVGEGPTGLVLDEEGGRLFVLNHFGASISVVDVKARKELERIALHDPTPAATRIGRKHLYDTHKNSGLGQIACASCHVDARIDRLAWDLGDPAGDMKEFNQNCIDILGLGGCTDYHPMKGPMLTQTLQDIIGHEPFHWRGDRDGLEEFNGAFIGLQGDDENLTDAEMQEYEDFLATIFFPPNPFRNLDNSLPDDLPLPGHYTTGRFGPAGVPLPNGDAQQGLDDFRTASLDGLQCVTCHTLPTGMGRNSEVEISFVPFPPFVVTTLVDISLGPDGEHHLGVTGLDVTNGETVKVPHLRNLYKRVGYEATQTTNTVGFGFLHDGSVDSIARFVAEPVFNLTSDQMVADQVAFMLSFSGSDLPAGGATNVVEPLGPNGQDTHAAVGLQVTFNGDNNGKSDVTDRFDTMQSIADDGSVGLVAKGLVANELRGYVYEKDGDLQSDRDGERISWKELIDGATPAATITFTVVPKGTELRIGIDRDEDGFWDRDELDACSDPADAGSIPEVDGCGAVVTFERGDCNGDGHQNLVDPLRLLSYLFTSGANPPCQDACDANDDGALNIVDPLRHLRWLFTDGLPPAAPHPDCGADPTPDDGLECVTPPAACD